MKQQDNMTDQPRRYRAQVKRAAKVKRDELPYQEPTAPQKEIPNAEAEPVTTKPGENEIELASDTRSGEYLKRA